MVGIRARVAAGETFFTETFEFGKFTELSERGAVATMTSTSMYPVAVVSPVLASGTHHAVFTLEKFGDRPEYKPYIGIVADSWDWNAFSNTYAHGYWPNWEEDGNRFLSTDDGSTGKTERCGIGKNEIQQGDHVGLLLHEGSLTVFLNGQRRGMMARSLMGRYRWAVTMWFKGERVRIKTGDQALWGAARNGETAKVRALLAAGTDPDTVDRYGATALHHAAMEGHREVLGALAEGGADLEKANNYGATPLMLATYHGESGVVRRLLELGADHTGVGTKYQYEGTRKTALEAAQAQGEHAVAAVLHAWAAGTRDATELDRLAVEATPREDPGGGPTRGGDDY